LTFTQYLFIILQQSIEKMKKVLFAFVIMGFLAACSNSTETTTVDSTACDTVKCDSMKCDSTKMVCDTAEVNK